MAATVRLHCASCAGTLRGVLNLGSTPLADQFPAKPYTDLPCYPLRMAACTACGLAQLHDVIDDGELFGEDYGFLTSGSPSLVRYYKTWAADMMRDFGPLPAMLTVDVGCNDGTLLSHFAAYGVPVLGVDPASSPALNEARVRNGVKVACHRMTEETGRMLRDDWGPAGLIAGINVAAHTADPVDFLKGVKALLHEDGVAVFEFHDLRHLVAGCQFDQVYHEHRFFYSAQTFAQLARQADLRVFRVIPTPGQGGSLRVYLRHKGMHVEHKSPLTSLEQLLTLQARAEWIRTQLMGKLETFDGRIAGYGASAKSCTLLNFCGIDEHVLRYVEDATASKVGRYTPGTNIPIVGPGSGRPEGYLLLVWNFLPDVLRRERDFIAAGGQFIVPIPVPMVI